MSLNLGSLVGYLDLDAEGFEGGLEGALGKLEGFASKGAVKAAAAGVAIAGAVGAAVVGSMNVEAANDKLAAQLGLSEDESARIGKLAGSLYSQNYGESLEDVNGAVASVMTSIGGMRSASSADLQAVTTQALNFATAMDVDVSSAAVSAGTLVKTGLADNAKNAFDLLTVTAQEAGPAMVEPIMDAANEYATNFAAMGYSGEEAMAMLVDASKNGEIALDKIGDATKEFSILAGTDLARTGPVYEQLGLNAEEMASKIVTGGSSAREATGQIIDGLLKIKDPSEQATAAIAFFGTPLEDLGVTQIPQFLDALSMSGGELEHVAGAADRMGATLNDNATANLESFKRQAEQAFVNLLGGRVLPIVNDVAGFLASSFGPALSTARDILADDVVPALRDTAEWMEANQTPLLVVAGIIAAIFIPHLIALGVQSLLTGAKTVVGWAMTQAGAVGAAAVHSVQVVRMIAGWVLMGAQSLLQGARMAAAWVIAMGPVGWVIAAVVGLVALIVANWDTVVGATKAAWEWVWGAVKAAVDFMVGLFLNFTLVGLIISHWDTIKRVFSDGVDGAVGFVTSLPGRILSGLGNLGSLLVGAGGDLMRGFVNGIAGAASFVGDVARNVVNAVIGFINSQVIGGINNLLEFTIPIPGAPDIHIDPPNLPSIPRLAEGGIVPATPGGVLAFIGEGGEDEMVIPRSKARDILGGGQGGGPVPAIQIENYYEAEGSSAHGTAEALVFLGRTRGDD